MITSIKIMNKRFRLVAPLLFVIMVIAIVAGGLEMYHNLVQYDYEYSNGLASGKVSIALARFPVEKFILITFLVVCLMVAIVAVYKNEHSYSTNMMATKNQNIIANSMLGIIVGLMIAVTYAIANYVGMHMEASRIGNIISSTVDSSLIGYIALGSLMFFIVFNALYYVILFLANLFKYNKLLCLVACIGIVLIYMCIVWFPIGLLEEKHPYLQFILSWKGKMSVAALYVVIGVASYISLVKNIEVKR